MNLTLTQHCLLVAAIAASLFVILSLPVTFSVTSKAFPAFVQMNAPSGMGVISHGVLFFVILFGLLCALRKVAKSS